MRRPCIRQAGPGSAVALALASILAAGPFQGAAGSDDPRAWVERMGIALHNLNYEGTLVHLHGTDTAVMRVVHRVEDGVPTERITAMDEAGREIIREGDDLTCILPDQNAVLVGRAGPDPDGNPLRQQFARDVHFDDRYYHLSIASGSRLVGRDTRLVTVRPTDGFRYGYRLWLDRVTAIPLKIQVAGGDGAVLEQLLFSDIRLGEPIPAAAVRPSLTVASLARSQPASEGPVPAPAATPAWQVAALPPGFGLRAARFQPAAGSGPLGHLVYSDGVAVVSVFIEAGVTPVEQREGLSALGAANAYTTVTEGQLVTAVGEVPARTVESMARSLRRVGAPGR